ncbi:UNVERIFIED_CONTAM: Mitogen-activated protein kinaseMMK1 [Sesamum radiatum]|uniref:Mitogen-activated protein kinaseMMK1 n=1 Tax=Sesamum radiatum TaxID=300843 RepID=A0AAW2QDA5_SESRA
MKSGFAEIIDVSIIILLLMFIPLPLYQIADFSLRFLSMSSRPVEDALAHPYLNSLHDISDEPVCMTPFSFDFEQHALTEDQMKELIYRESLAFNPEYQM